MGRKSEESAHEYLLPHGMVNIGKHEDELPIVRFNVRIQTQLRDLYCVKLA
jgi:hypothetical protein